MAGGQTQTIRSPLVFLPPDIFDSTNVFIGCLELSMSDTYVIPAGMREYKDGDLSIKLEWTSFTPESAPTADTKG